MKLILFFFLSILMIYLNAAKVGAAMVARSEVESFLPEQFAGWKLTVKARRYDRENIFDYMDGAGEFYLAYDFTDLYVGEYKKGNSEPVNVEIYRMATSKDAFGVYSHDLDGKKVEMGHDAIYAQGFLKGWKSNIFIRLVAMRETSDNKQFILSFARQLFERLNEAGEKPGLLKKLPSADLIPDSVSYFHKNTSLNNIYFLATANILNLSEKTFAVSARYKVNDSEKARLIIIEYPDDEEA